MLNGQAEWHTTDMPYEVKIDNLKPELTGPIKKTIKIKYDGCGWTDDLNIKKRNGSYEIHFEHLDGAPVASIRAYPITKRVGGIDFNKIVVQICSSKDTAQYLVTVTPK